MARHLPHEHQLCLSGIQKMKKTKLQAWDHDDYRSGPGQGVPEHQLERGPRYGNQRKMQAHLKTKERRIQRARAKNEFLQEDFL